MVYKNYELLTCNHPDTGELITEEFRPVKDYEGRYEISSFGRVLSLNYKFTKLPKILTQSVNTHGYMKVTLTANGISKTKQVHKLVAIAFHDHVPNGFSRVVDHKDFDKKNNKAHNLRLITQRQNSICIKSTKTSKYTGVHWSKTANKWRSVIVMDRKNVGLGTFTDEFAAHIAYQNKLKEITA